VAGEEGNSAPLQADSFLEHYGRTDFNTPFTLTSFFFPLSTGLAELWGGWPIEQVE